METETWESNSVPWNVQQTPRRFPKAREKATLNLASKKKIAVRPNSSYQQGWTGLILNECCRVSSNRHKKIQFYNYSQEIQIPCFQE